ncbi:MAG: alpha/beta fold hydrolase [Pararhodobacter sp.]|nr:alpha/beta fold hydrolase [Pararhodobacter sp.]
MCRAVLVPFLAGFVALSGCADRATVDLVPTPAAGAVLQPVLVATTRGDAPDLPVPGWSRETDLTFGRYVVAIPPQHEPGSIRRPRPGTEFDPSRHFGLAGQHPLSSADFRAALRQELASQPAEEREAIIFVHGFNTSFVEGLYRVAQLSNDLALPGVAMHYSWPSMGVPLAYAHDRDSALFARDGLQQMLHDVAATNVPRIILIAHSMGSHLVMETLRQMALERDPRLSRIGGVILIAPDIDVDLFGAQARRIGRLPQPFVIVTSRRDRILQLSARLTGETARLGNLPDAGILDEFELTVLDVSAYSTGRGHFTLGSSPALIQLLSQLGIVNAALSDDAAGALPLLPATILTLQNTTQIILQPLTETRARRIMPLPRLAPAGN